MIFHREGMSDGSGGTPSRPTHTDKIFFLLLNNRTQEEKRETHYGANTKKIIEVEKKRSIMKIKKGMVYKI